MDVRGQVLLELVPADLNDLVSNVALHHLHKVHHLVSVGAEREGGEHGIGTSRKWVRARGN